MNRKITIAATGCVLADYLYSGIDFSTAAFRKLCSRAPGDGGLVPGGLVFGEEIERFANAPLDEVLRAVGAGRESDAVNLGGPAIVAICSCAQILSDEEASVSFFGASGEDDVGRFTREAVSRCGIKGARYKILRQASPVTYVLSDQSAAAGQGERSFINVIGAGGEFGPEDLDESFFDADILLFGGTAIVPRLHDGLTELLERGKSLDRITVVTTVYDFRSQRENPHARWPMGRSDDSYRSIDLLMVDREEALRLSGCGAPEEALDFFRRRGVGACLITNGAAEVLLFSRGELFAPAELRLPVSAEVCRRLERADGPRDTTGCGDNFAGGVLSGIALQLRRGASPQLDLTTACALGIVNGGLACFYLGGAKVEGSPGERRGAVAELYAAYRRQLSAASLLPVEGLFPEWKADRAPHLEEA